MEEENIFLRRRIDELLKENLELKNQLSLSNIQPLKIVNHSHPEFYEFYSIEIKNEFSRLKLCNTIFSYWESEEQYSLVLKSKTIEYYNEEYIYLFCSGGRKSVELNDLILFHHDNEKLLRLREYILSRASKIVKFGKQEILEE